MADKAKKSEENEEAKKVFVPRTAAEIQRFKFEKLMKKMEAGKEAYIPEAKEVKLPRVFNPPEFIRNVWGSSAGAGSGDFHVYRGVRRRENARQKHMNEMTEKERKDVEFRKKFDVHKQEAVDKTLKKRDKRQKKKQKQKANKKMKRDKKPEDVDEDEDESSEEETELSAIADNPENSKLQNNNDNTEYSTAMVNPNTSATEDNESVSNNDKSS